MADGRATYAITLALDNLKVLDRLYTELRKVQELANQGAAFNIRVGSEPISRMRNTVATAVAEAVAEGLREANAALVSGGKLPEGYFDRVTNPTRTAAGGGDNKLLLGRLEGLESTIRRLAMAIERRGFAQGGVTGSGTTTPAAPRAVTAPERAAVNERVSEFHRKAAADPETQRLRETLKRLREETQTIRRFRQAKPENLKEVMQLLKDSVALASTPDDAARFIQENRQVAEYGRKARQRLAKFRRISPTLSPEKREQADRLAAEIEDDVVNQVNRALNQRDTDLGLGTRQTGVSKKVVETMRALRLRAAQARKEAKALEERLLSEARELTGAAPARALRPFSEDPTWRQFDDQEAAESRRLHAARTMLHIRQREGTTDFAPQTGERTRGRPFRAQSRSLDELVDWFTASTHFLPPNEREAGQQEAQQWVNRLGEYRKKYKRGTQGPADDEFRDQVLDAFARRAESVPDLESETQRLARTFKQTRSHKLSHEDFLKQQGFASAQAIQVESELRAQAGAAPPAGPPGGPPSGPVPPDNRTTNQLLRELITAIHSNFGAPRERLLGDGSAREIKNDIIYGGAGIPLFPKEPPETLLKTEEGRQTLSYLEKNQVSFAPFSEGKKRGIIYLVDKLSREIATGTRKNEATGAFDPLDEREVELTKDRLSELGNLFAMGGKYYTQGDPEVVRGLLTSNKERQRIAEGQLDPALLRQAQRGPRDDKILDKLALRNTAREAKSLADVMERLAKVDLNPIKTAFASVTEALTALRANLVPVVGLLEKSTNLELKLQYEGKSQEQRRAHLREVESIKANARRGQGQDPVAAARERLSKDIALGRGVGVAVPANVDDAQRLGMQVQRTLRRMNTLYERMSDAQYDIQVMNQSGADPKAVRQPLKRLVYAEDQYTAQQMKLGDQLAALAQSTVLESSGPARVSGPVQFVAGLMRRKLPSVSGGGFQVSPEERANIERFVEERKRLQDTVTKVRGLSEKDAAVGEARDEYVQLLNSYRYARSDDAREATRAQISDASGRLLTAESARIGAEDQIRSQLGLQQSPERVAFGARVAAYQQSILDALAKEAALRKQITEQTKQEEAVGGRLRAVRAELRRIDAALKEDDVTPERRQALLTERGALTPESDLLQELQTASGRTASSRAELRTVEAGREEAQSGMIDELKRESETRQDITDGLRKQVEQTNALAAGLVPVAERLSKIRTLTSTTTAFFNELGTKIRTVAEYALASGGIYTVFSTLRRGFAGAVDFESQLADIQGVFVKKTNAERESIAQGVLSAGGEFGVPLGQITSTAKTFAQTGAAPSDVLNLTRASLTAAQGAGISSDLATELLIAVKEISNGTVAPENIVDRISLIEARNAVTSQDLATAIQRVGSLATQLQPQAIGGIDAFDAVIGATTQIVEATRQTGAQAATGLKFILSRLTAPDIQKKLTEDFGIKLTSDEAGKELRPVLDILGDIAALYKSFLQPDAQGNTQSKRGAELLGVVAGARQVNTAAALFQDFNKVLDTARESAFSYGDAQRRLQIQLDTLASRMQQTSNAFAQFSNRLVNEGALGYVSKGIVTGAGVGLRAASQVAGGPEIVTGATAFGLSKLYESVLLPKGVAAAQAQGGLVARGIVGSTAALIPIIALVGKTLIALGIGALLLKLFKGELDLRNSLYKPQPFDREAFNNSELGQGFAIRAREFGTSPGRLVDDVLAAEVKARNTVLQRRGRNGGLLIASGATAFDPNSTVKEPALYKAFVDEFTKALGDVVPALRNIKDESLRQVQAMALLKETVRRANVELDTQGAGFAASAEEVGQILRDNLQTAIGVGFKTAVKNVPGNIAGALSSSPIEGFLKATKLPGLGSASLGQGILGSYIAPNKVFNDVLQEIQQGGKSLAAALDQIARDFYGAGDPKQQDIGVQKFSAVLLPELRKTFAKQLTPPGGPELDANAGEGGTFAKLFLDAYTAATRQLITELSLTKNDASRALATLNVLENPRTRGATTAAIQAEVNARAMRGLLKDEILEAIARYGQAQAEIRTASGLSRGRLTYDRAREDAGAADAFFKNVVGAVSGLQGLLLKAQIQSTSLTPESLQASYESVQGLDDEGLKALVSIPNLQDAYKAAATGPQARELAVTIGRLKQAVQDIAADRDLFADLPKELQAGVRRILEEGLTDKNAALSARTILEAARNIKEARDSVLLARQGRLQSLDLSTSRNQQELQLRTAAAQQELATSQRLAELVQDFQQIYNLQYGAAQLGYETAVQEARLSRNRALAALEEQRGILNPQEFSLQEQGILGEFSNTLAKAGGEFQTQLQQLNGEVRQRVAEMTQAQIQTLREPWIAGIRALFVDYRNLSRQGLLNALEGIGATLQERVANIFAEKLVGQQGIFGNLLDQLLGQEIFADQMLVRAADVTLVGTPELLPADTPPKFSRAAEIPYIPSAVIRGLTSSIEALKPITGVVPSPRSGASLPAIKGLPRVTITAPGGVAQDIARAAAVTVRGPSVQPVPTVEPALLPGVTVQPRPTLLPRVTTVAPLVDPALLPGVTVRPPAAPSQELPELLDNMKQYFERANPFGASTAPDPRRLEPEVLKKLGALKDTNRYTNRLDLVEPDFRTRLEAMMTELRGMGHKVKVVESFRTQQRQDYLASKGSAVTKTSNSKHTHGIAADLLLDNSYDQNARMYPLIERLAAKYGLETIGDWDAGHVQLPATRTDSTLEAQYQRVLGGGGGGARSQTRRLLDLLAGTRSSPYLTQDGPLGGRLPLVAPITDVVRQGDKAAPFLDVPAALLPRGPSFGDKLKAYGGDLKRRLSESGLGSQALFLGASLGGAAIGNTLGVQRGRNYAQSGASLGATVGSLFGPVGTLAGGVLGGFLGGRIGRKRDPKTPESSALERIEANTRETVTVLENGVALRNLDQRFLNVPAGFTIPNYNPLPSFSGSAGRQGTGTVNQTFQITVQVTEAKDARGTAQEVLRELRRQSRNIGSFATPRQ